MTRAVSRDPRPERPAPEEWLLESGDGTTHLLRVTSPTVVISVKSHCDGCRSFFAGDLSALGGFAVVVCTSEELTESRFPGHHADLVRSEGLLRDLGLLSAPFYALVVPDPPRVVAEGLAFDPSQVAAELSAWV